MKNNLYIKIARYGFVHPEGFTQTELINELQLEEWEEKIISEYVNDALYNSTRFTREGDLNPTRDTIFVMIGRKQDEPGGAENPAFTLSYNAFFDYIDYLELLSAKETSADANRNARIALWAVVITTLISFGLTYWQIKSPVELSDKQLEKIIRLNKEKQEIKPSFLDMSSWKR